MPIREFLDKPEPLDGPRVLGSIARLPSVTDISDPVARLKAIDMNLVIRVNEYSYDVSDAIEFDRDALTISDGVNRSSAEKAAAKAHRKIVFGGISLTKIVADRTASEIKLRNTKLAKG